MKAVVGSQTLWFSAARSLGWGSVCLYTLFALDSLQALLSVAEPQLAPALMILLRTVVALSPFAVIIASALRATRPPSFGWKYTSALLGVGVPTSMILWYSCTWPHLNLHLLYCYSWLCTVAAWAAIGFVLLPLCPKAPGDPTGLPAWHLWCLVLCALGGIALGVGVFAMDFARPNPMDPLAVLGRLYWAHLLITCTVACYGLAAFWRFLDRCHRAALSPPSLFRGGGGESPRSPRRRRE